MKKFLQKEASSKELIKFVSESKEKDCLIIRLGRAIEKVSKLFAFSPISKSVGDVSPVAEQIARSGPRQKPLPEASI